MVLLRRFILLFCLFCCSPFVFAANGDYVEGYYWRDPNHNYPGSQTALGAAENIFAVTRPDYISISFTNWGTWSGTWKKVWAVATYKDVNNNNQTTGSWVYQWPVNSCTEEWCYPPGPDCPEAGTKKRLAIDLPKDTQPTPLHVCVDNSTGDSCASSAQGSPVKIEYDGCEYEYVPSDWDFNLRVLEDGTYQPFLDISATATGNTSSGVTSPTASVDDAPVNDTASPTTDSSTFVDPVPQETKTSTPIPEQTETLVDGTEVTTTGQTVTEVRSDGAVVTTDQNSKTVDWGGGITKTTTTTTTTTTYPDGSKEVVTTTQQSYTDSGSDRYTVQNDDGSVTYTNLPGSGTAVATKTTTTNVDANGNVTGSSESSTVSGDDQAAEEQQEQSACEKDPNSKDCTGEFDPGDGQEHGFEGGKANAAYAAAMSEWNSVYSDIKSEMNAMFSNVSGGGTLQSNEITVRGATGDIGITKWLPYFDNFNLAALIMACAALYAFFVLMRGSSNG